MPAPLYGADDPAPLFRQFRIGGAGKIQKELRPDNVATAGNERGKGISPLYMACRERRTRANLPDIHPTIPQSHLHQIY